MTDKNNNVEPTAKKERPLLNLKVLVALIICFLPGFIVGMIEYRRHPGLFSMAIANGIAWIIISFLLGAVVRWFGVAWLISFLSVGFGLFALFLLNMILTKI